MKNIHTILSELGIAVPEDKKTDLDKAVAENYKTIAEHENKVQKLTDKLTVVQERADTAEATLKGFEGKDFEAITKERDEWKQKHDEKVAAYQREQEEREFNDILSAAITDAKGKNAKAITALLDLDKLRGSRNLDKDIKSALDALRTESGYLFDDNGGAPHFTDPKGNGGNAGGTTTIKDIMGIRDPVERQKAIGQNLSLFRKGE